MCYEQISNNNVIKILSLIELQLSILNYTLGNPFLHLKPSKIVQKRVHAKIGPFVQKMGHTTISVITRMRPGEKGYQK